MIRYSVARLWVFIILSLPGAALAQEDVGRIANAICNQSQEQYQCDYKVQTTAIINNRKIDCWNRHFCSETLADESRLVGECYWNTSEKPARGRCRATNYYDAEGNRHDLSQANLPSNSSMAKFGLGAQLSDLGTPICTECNDSVAGAQILTSSFSGESNLSDESASQKTVPDYGKMIRDFSSDQPSSAVTENPPPVGSPNFRTFLGSLLSTGDSPPPTLEDISPKNDQTFTAQQATGFDAPSVPQKDAWYSRAWNGAVSEWNSLCWSDFGCFSASVRHVFRCRSDLCS